MLNHKRGLGSGGYRARVVRGRRRAFSESLAGVAALALVVTVAGRWAFLPLASGQLLALAIAARVFWARA